MLTEDTNGTVLKYQNGPGIDNKLSVKQGTTTNYFLADHLGSTNALTDSTGAITASQSYDSFGNPMNSNFPTRYQFTGREYDQTTRLQFSRARFYDPKLGRFISEDPIGFGGGDVNLYGYVGNNPVGLRDPLGLLPTGSDLADWLDARFETAQDFYGYDPVVAWDPIFGPSTAFGLLRGGTNIFRVGTGVGEAIYTEDLPDYRRMELVSEDIVRGGSLFLSMACPISGRFSGGAKPGVPANAVSRSLNEEAAALVDLNGGKNRVTLRSNKFQVDVDLQGKAHAGIPTPHTKLSLRNMNAPEGKVVYNTSNKQALLERSTVQDIRLARRYLRSKNRR